MGILFFVSLVFKCESVKAMSKEVDLINPSGVFKCVWSVWGLDPHLLGQKKELDLILKLFYNIGRK